MRKLFVLAAVMVVAAVVAGGASADKPAPTLTCTTYVSGGDYGNVVVPDDADCYLYDVVVEGNVSVGVGASFYATGSEIQGNLSASGAYEVSTGVSGGLSPIDGNVSIDSTTQDVYLDAPVGGNARFTDNNRVYFNGVHFYGNLACSGNSHVYFYFTNTVDGHASGQCADYGGGG